MTKPSAVRLEITKTGEVRHPQTCGHIDCRPGTYENVPRVVAKAVELAGYGRILKDDPPNDLPDELPAKSTVLT